MQLRPAREPINATISQAASALLQLKGKPLSLYNYEPFQFVYDCSPPTLVIKAGRQIGKSLSLAAILITNSIMRNYFSNLYIAPLSQQTSRFSGAYLDPFLYSPLVRKYFIDTTSKKNVFEKSLRNGSRIYLGYADTEQSADRIRGVTSDLLLLDEIQDISLDAIPILKETMAASDYNFTRLTGTAKTENNSLEISWKRSCMAEWVVKCTHCSRHTVPIDFDTCLKILDGVEGPACIHCSKPLDMRTGQWLAARPDRTDNVGVHIPQLILPARTNIRKWNELKEKARTYPMQKLANEVFGLASGIGGRILSLREAMACCNSERTEWDKGFPIDDRHILYTTLGVDWSVSGSNKSYTVISILGYDSKGKAYLLYCQRLNGVDIIDQVHRVEQLYRQYKCSMACSDRGVGVLQAQLLQRSLGHDKVHMVQYVAAKHALRWDRDGDFFSADRTRSMDTVIMKAKIGPSKFETPAWSLTGEFWQDALNVFEEESMSGRRLYRKDEDLTDDSLHSWVFANLAFSVLNEEFIYLDTPAGGEENFLSFN
jgi:hypothetical protein